jgi:hypothetical protein
LNMDAKKLCIKLFLFLLPVAAIWGYLEYRLAQIPNTYNQKRAYLEQQLDSIEVLALGTSHVLYGLDPAYFSVHGFNLANVNQSVYYNKRLALHYISRMPKLKVVIMEIGYFSLYYQIMNDKREKWRDYFYAQYWGIGYKDLPYWDMKRFSKVALYSVDKVKEFARGNFRVNLAEGLRYNGFMPKDTLRPRDSAQLAPENFTTRIQGLNKLADTNEYAYNYRDLESFTDELTRRHVRIVFVTTPWLPQLVRLANAELFRRNEAAARALCGQYSCTYFNYLNDSRFTVKDFADPNHLNYLGAKKLSTIIDSEIISPAVRKLTATP